MSRKLLVPFQLPADPVNPLEATTKQYVDSLTIVSATDPIAANPGCELWVDTTTVPGAVLASQITATAPGAPITGTDVQTILNQLPRGIVARSDNAAQVSVPTTGGPTYLQTAIAITLVTGRLYKISWHMRAVGRQDGSDTPANHNMGLYDGTTSLGWIDCWHQYRGAWSSLSGFVLRSGDNVARSLRTALNNPSAALYVYPTHFIIEDIGVG
jgi:hypothetical protein